MKHFPIHGTNHSTTLMPILIHFQDKKEHTTTLTLISRKVSLNSAQRTNMRTTMRTTKVKAASLHERSLETANTKTSSNLVALEIRRRTPLFSKEQIST